MKKFLLLLTLAFGVQQLNALTVTINHTNVTCNSSCNGTATAVPSGGTAPYTYAWNPLNTGNPITGLCAGNYTVTVTDALAAVASATVTILQPALLAISCSSVPTTTCASCDGVLNANVTGGTPPYSYTCIPNGPISIPEPNVCSGTYTITVTDAQGCTASGITIVGQPPAMSLSFTTTTISCNGGTGNVTAVVFGGTAPYTYNWMPGNYTTATITNVPAGTYTCTVTDANNCTQGGICVLTQPSTINAGISAPASTCLGTNVAFVPNVTGGTAPYAYSWTFPGGTPATSTSQNPIVVWNAAGTYTVTMDVWDANGCTATGNFVITIFGAPIVTTSMIPASCNMSNGTVDATVTGGLPPYAFNWQPGNVVAMPYTNAIPNISYTLTTADANGCTTTSIQLLGDSCDFVWPGDANDDAIADNTDILDIGIANGATGTTRANATLNWIGQPSTPWGQTLLSGTDYKWVDCNGDGIINPSDTNAVIQNFGLTHNNRFGGIPIYDATLPDLTITMGQNALASNSAGTLSVAFGTSSIPVSNFYGLAFTLNFDAAQIDASTFRMDETGTWMGIPGNDMMGVVMNNGNGTGSVQIAITRLNHANANGFGNIANVGFMTTGNLVGTGNAQNVNFSISNVTVISANETPQNVNTINDSVIVEDPILLSVNAIGMNFISAFPNPFDESVQINLPESAIGKNCMVTLTDATGRIVLEQKTENANSIIIHRGILETGIYFCTVRSEGQMIGNAKLIVK